VVADTGTKNWCACEVDDISTARVLTCLSSSRNASGVKSRSTLTLRFVAVRATSASSSRDSPKKQMPDQHFVV
jgi:hypothetical protein